MRKSRWLRRGLITLGIGVPLFALFTLVVHIPAVQYAMGWTKSDGTAACPFGHGAARAVATAKLDASENPALGFALGQTTRDDLTRWAATSGVTCKEKRGTIECREVPGPLLAAHGAELAGTTLWFDLDPNGTLVTVKSARRSADVARVATAFTATEATLAKQAGTPRIATGATAELSAGAFRQATREFRRDKYRALVRATNMGDGYLLTESYSAL